MKVIGALFTVSLVMGSISYFQFMSSEEDLQKDFAQIRTRGADLGVEECVDAVLVWHEKECSAMKVLCDKSVGRMMEQCLAGGDRSAWCQSNDTSASHNSGFGFHECKARGTHNSRKKKKVCGTTYQAIAAHCRIIGTPEATGETGAGGNG